MLAKYPLAFVLMNLKPALGGLTDTFGKQIAYQIQSATSCYNTVTATSMIPVEWRRPALNSAVSLPPHWL